MKSSSLFPLIGTSIALCATPAHATGASNNSSPDKNPTPGNSQNCDNPSSDNGPKPGNSKKCTRVDFDHPNNGWGNGDQDPPGNSGDNNNAENGQGNTPPPGISDNKVVARRAK
jgi:hypothetical protein